MLAQLVTNNWFVPLDSLRRQLKRGEKALIGNKGYRRYLERELSRILRRVAVGVGGRGAMSGLAVVDLAATGFAVGRGVGAGPFRRR